MAHISKRLYKPLTNDINREDTGIYYDEANSRIVAGHDGTIYEAPLHIASQARGDVLRRGANTWERLAAGANGAQLIGDGTDIVVAGSYHHAMALERQKNRCFVNFLKQPQVPLFAKNTMAILTAVNSQEDFFHVNGHYFELSQGTANTAMAAGGLTPGASGWLLTGDNAAADWIEITRGIASGSAASYVVGTDSFFLRVAFLITTRARHTHLYAGFRAIGAYADAKTNADHLAAYDDKVAIGISTNAGVLTRHTSIATADVATNAAHAAAANGDVLALQVSVDATGLTSCMIGHATPAGATFAELEAARVAAIANLATDASIVAVPKTMTSAAEFVPYIVYGMAGGTDVSDTRLMSFEASYNE